MYVITVLAHLYNGHIYNGQLSWSQLYNRQLYNGQLYNRHMSNRTFVQWTVEQWSHVKLDSFTTGHLYNGLLKDGHLYTQAIVKADICTTNIWTGCTCTNVKVYKWSQMSGGTSIHFWLSGCSIIHFSNVCCTNFQLCNVRFSSSWLHNCPIVQMMSIIHMLLYNCLLYEWPLHIYSMAVIITNCHFYSNISQILLLLKTWGNYNKFYSTKLLRIYYWYC